MATFQREAPKDPRYGGRYWSGIGLPYHLDCCFSIYVKKGQDIERSSLLVFENYLARYFLSHEAMFSSIRKKTVIEQAVRIVVGAQTTKPVSMAELHTMRGG
jgi:hypothetical protein